MKTLRTLRLRIFGKTIFHHLTKDELIEKLLANYLPQNKTEIAEKPVKKFKN